MTTAELKKRVSVLEKELKLLQKEVGLHRPSVDTAHSLPKKKKMSAGLRQGIKEWKAGKVSGPFKTADELMAHLEK